MLLQQNELQGAAACAGALNANIYVLAYNCQHSIRQHTQHTSAYVSMLRMLTYAMLTAYNCNASLNALPQLNLYAANRALSLRQWRRCSGRDESGFTTALCYCFTTALLMLYYCFTTGRFP
jgi:hypothetical protein